jgi:hypothetical protein
MDGYKPMASYFSYFELEKHCKEMLYDYLRELF